MHVIWKICKTQYVWWYDILGRQHVQHTLFIHTLCSDSDRLVPVLLTATVA